MRPLMLPIELYELAIDFLDDEESLKATSLVCRAWLPRSRLNLFRTVELCLPRHLNHLVDLLSDAPHLAEYVEQIDISENSLLGVLRPSMAIVARLPHALTLHPLLKPRRLAVHNQLWLPTRYSPDYLFSLSRLSSITSLDLFDVTFLTVADFSIILRALHQLQFLSARHLDCQRQLDLGTAADVGCVLPFLTTLHVSSYYPTSVIDWLLQHNRFPVLRDVRCSYELSPGDNTQGLGTFWKNAGSTLEILAISISKRSAGARFSTTVVDARELTHTLAETQLDLSSCCGLRELRFDCRHERGVAPDWTWLTWLLSHLTCRTLRSIVFAFQSTSHALACVHTFAEELEAALTRSPFSAGLDSVVFKFDFRDPADPDDERFLDMFPSLRSMNLFQGMPCAFALYSLGCLSRSQ
ncbi:hypothetical protein BV20DRAFT_1045732 [Pilatotrama ljubarskyi]|nr:hypothetical protein BV20DRAFT_1045732 [Pilatotrama ljubarskyi]